MYLLDKGFTLLELLIAILLSTFVVVVCVSILRLSSDSLYRSTKFSRKLENKTLGVFLFYAQLQSIPNPSRVGVSKTFLKCEENELEFITTKPITNSSYPGIFLAGYRIENGCIWEKDTPIISPKNVKADLGDIEDGWMCLRRFKEKAYFNYFSGRDWQSRWRGKGVPRAISLTIDEDTLVIPIVQGLEKTID